MRCADTLPVVFFILVCASCTPAVPGSEAGQVVRVVDGDTLEVELPDRKERVRLLGVDTPEMTDEREVVRGMAIAARALVDELVSGHEVTLERDPQADDRDRYGRALRYVRLADGTMLNAVIVERGFGHAMLGFPFSRRDEFVRLEAEAREAARGLWAEGATPRVEAGEAATVVGRWATVCGSVASGRYLASARGQPTLLNLDKPYPDQPFTVVIRGEDRARFGEPEIELRDARICVTGRVELYRGRPQVEVADPSRLLTTHASP